MSNEISLPSKSAILTVAVSSRALFHLESENTIFEEQGEVAFNAFMRDKHHEILPPGSAFDLVKKLLGLNRPGKPLAVEVVVLSRNSPAAGLRVMHSVRLHGLDIEKAVFTGGTDRFRYAKSLGADLFLSANAYDVKGAIEHGVAAATMVPGIGSLDEQDTVRVAFDGDSVLFNDVQDKMFREVGLERWREHELANANVPLGDGPFRRVIEKLHSVKVDLGKDESHLVRLALVTARGAPAHERALRTLMSWGITLDEAIFAAGMAKGPLLKSYGAHVFFDDGVRNIASAIEFDIPSGHVPSV